MIEDICNFEAPFQGIVCVMGFAMINVPSYTITVKILELQFVLYNFSKFIVEIMEVSRKQYINS